MDMKIYRRHYETIRDMIKDLGIDGTDEYLQEEMKIVTKNVSALREKVDKLKDTLAKITNTDERTHIEYDVQDQEDLLRNLLLKLKIIDERYVCFKEYVRARS
ncbi:archaellum biogenesis ATPase FlaH [Anaerosolibacter carboniphilus]|uniref:Archaellum biogenesis ATPase FlaH n=1 Tax=Anaerosolibacter carboniphilus TaxID=1417629 RepID=A0A841L680_9FIRM|nr:hypothetical protein [Anaerosolibacter carboniphilus]MBB6218602.1 archaellum biogenesis ATPase FlaH [Anaerosolibacter carboniphilus]